MPMKTLIERLLAKVEKQSNGCWLWMGGKVRGYGQIRRGGRGSGLMLTHRVSFEHFVGPIPDGLCILHSCDIPACVNPDHLFLGTHKDNTADCVKKGRFADNKGEANGRSKLTEENIRSIRAMRHAGETQKSIADHFGVSYGHVSLIISGKNWAHVALQGEPRVAKHLAREKKQKALDAEIIELIQSMEEEVLGE